MPHHLSLSKHHLGPFRRSVPPCLPPSVPPYLPTSVSAGHMATGLIERTRLKLRRGGGVARRWRGGRSAKDGTIARHTGTQAHRSRSAREWQPCQPPLRRPRRERVPPVALSLRASVSCLLSAHTSILIPHVESLTLMTLPHVEDDEVGEGREIGRRERFDLLVGRPRAEMTYRGASEVDQG